MQVRSVTLDRLPAASVTQTPRLTLPLALTVFFSKKPTMLQAKRSPSAWLHR